LPLKGMDWHQGHDAHVEGTTGIKNPGMAWQGRHQ
jgi:hypothetical protein